MDNIRVHATITNEAGILSKKGGGFHTPSSFALENLFYLLWGDEYECNEKYEVKRDFLNSLSLYHIISGKMEFNYNGQSFIATEGETVFLDLRLPHHYRALTRLQLRQYLIGGRSAEQYYELLSKQLGYRYAPDGKLSLILENIQRQAISDNMNEHTVSIMLHELMGHLVIRETPSISASVAQAQRYILRHFSEPLSIEDVAAHVLLSKSHLNRLFRKELSCAPHEYLLQTRLNISKQLLIETALSVEEIAYKSGFTSATHYIRAFKQANQMTPSYFRKYFNPLVSFPSES